MAVALHPNLGACFAPGRDPAKVALIDTRDWDAPRSFTYAALEAECDAVARGLLARGLQRGDRVGILALNRAEFLVAFFGIVRAGMVAVPINFKLPRETIDHIARDAGVRPCSPMPSGALVAAGLPARLRRRRRRGRAPRPRRRSSRRIAGRRARHDPLHLGLERPAQGRAADPWRLSLGRGGCARPAADGRQAHAGRRAALPHERTLQTRMTRWRAARRGADAASRRAPLRRRSALARSR